MVADVGILTMATSALVVKRVVADRVVVVVVSVVVTVTGEVAVVVVKLVAVVSASCPEGVTVSPVVSAFTAAVVVAD